MTQINLVRLVHKTAEKEEFLSPSLLTRKILDKVLSIEPSLDDPITALTIQEGYNLLQELALRSQYLKAMMILQPEITEDFLLIFKIGVLTGAALHNPENALELQVIRPEKQDEPDPK